MKITTSIAVSVIPKLDIPVFIFLPSPNHSRLDNISCLYLIYLYAVSPSGLKGPEIKGPNLQAEVARLETVLRGWFNFVHCFLFTSATENSVGG